MGGILLGFTVLPSQTSMSVARAAHSWVSPFAKEYLVRKNSFSIRRYGSIVDRNRLKRLGLSKQRLLGNPWFNQHFLEAVCPGYRSFLHRCPYRQLEFCSFRTRIQTLRRPEVELEKSDQEGPRREERRKRKFVTRSLSRGRKTQEQSKTLQSGDVKYIEWWREKVEDCKKSSTKELVKRLRYNNLLGLNESLRHGNLRGGKMNAEMLEMKRQFPHEVLLYRCGEFYEAVGFDACLLVEYAGLNPMGGLRSDTVPKAGCPIMNLRQALDELTHQGFSICIVEEVQGPQAKGQLKDRFIAGHAHPGSPYVYGLVGADIDLEFPEPVPVVGISRSKRGYRLVSVLEMMHSFAVEDALTEEAAVAKLRSRQSQRLFLHQSLRNDTSGVARWGEGGLLWRECQQKQQEWYDGDPLENLLSKVRELYDLDENEEFRETVIPPGERPRPLYVSTASQIGILPTAGVPSLLKVLLPSDANHLCVSYLRNLLLHPPPYRVTDCIQAACQELTEITTPIPDFTCVSAAKLVKLIEAKEANHIEFARMRNIAEDILFMAGDAQLRKVLHLLLDPTWLATEFIAAVLEVLCACIPTSQFLEKYWLTMLAWWCSRHWLDWKNALAGIPIEGKQLVEDCNFLASRVGDILASDTDSEQTISTGECIPDDFFRDLEDHWRGRVKRIHAEEVYANVESTAAELSDAVCTDFLPIVNCIKGYQKPLGGGLTGRRGEICYSRECQAVWFRGKNFKPTIWGRTPGEAEMKQLITAYNGKGTKVGDEWFTTTRVEEALVSYRIAVEKASIKVVELLRGLAEELKAKMNALIFISCLSVIAKALCMHVCEGKRRNWVFPTLSSCDMCTSDSDREGTVNPGRMVLVDLIPYWKDPICENAEPNTIDMESMFLLTGPNGGGKSSILRSICAAALLSVCGLMVPAREALVPKLDAIMLRMMSTDSPADNKSSFQMEMSELRTILAEATDRSLVLVDELCRGTEVQKGTSIAASVIESLDRIGCIGILSTHLHDLLDMKLHVKNVVQKSMGLRMIAGQVQPTWKLMSGPCRESLAFEVARKEGVPENVVQRAEELYEELLYSIRQDTGIHSARDSDNSWMAGIKETRASSNGETSMLAVEEFDQSGILTVVSKIAGGSNVRLSEQRRGLVLVNGVQKSKPKRNLKDMMEIYNSTCKKKLIEIGAVNCHDVSCSLLGPRQLPPPSTTNHSCVYMLQRPDGKFYVGQSDNLLARVRRHRTEWNEAPFLYVIVANKSVACELETILINQLALLGFALVNKADQKHRHFGTAALMETPPF